MTNDLRNCVHQAKQLRAGSPGEPLPPLQTALSRGGGRVTDETEAIIAELHPAIQRHAWTMVSAARNAGIPLVIISGKRSPAHNRRVGGAPNSAHVEGLAFDVAIYGYTRDQVPAEFWQLLGLWAERNLGLRWGGRFTHQGEPDVNHFDLKLLSV